MAYFVYILRTSSNTLYTGQTNNLEKRLKEHKEKKKGAKYLKYFDSFELVYREEFLTLTEAMKRERQLKAMTKTKKESLIADKKENERGIAGATGKSDPCEVTTL